MKQIESCIVGSTPRSGSTLLCDLLTDTGVAGQPHSYFRREDISWWAEQFRSYEGRSVADATVPSFH
ncbi:MAG: Stf0 family sulfotransferase, partial [bacterium]|nr:Stf0 family sulfotransferase [bacterium]